MVGATGFKTLEGSKLMRARCRKPGCTALDPWEHFEECYEVPEIGELGHKGKKVAIVKLCKRAEVYNSIKPKASGVIYEKGRKE